MPGSRRPSIHDARNTQNRGSNFQVQLDLEEQGQKEASSATRATTENSATRGGLQTAVQHPGQVEDAGEPSNPRPTSPFRVHAQPAQEQDSPQDHSANLTHSHITSAQQASSRELPDATEESHQVLQHAATSGPALLGLPDADPSPELRATSIFTEALRRAESRRMSRRINLVHQDLQDAGPAASSLEVPSLEASRQADLDQQDSSHADQNREDPSHEDLNHETSTLEERERTLRALTGADLWQTEETGRPTSVRLVPPPRLRRIFGRRTRRAQIGSIAQILRASDDAPYRSFLLGGPVSAFSLLSRPRPRPTAQDFEDETQESAWRPSSLQQTLHEVQRDFRRHTIPVPRGIQHQEWWTQMEGRLGSFGQTDEEMRESEDSRWTTWILEVPDEATLEALVASAHQWQIDGESDADSDRLQLHERALENGADQRQSGEHLFDYDDDDSSNGKLSFVESDYVKRLSRFGSDPDFRNVTGVHGGFELPNDPDQVRSSLHNNGPLSIPQPPTFPFLNCAWQDIQKEVQRFKYFVLTCDRWRAWDGTPIALAWPQEVIAFCSQCRPSVLSLNTATDRADLLWSDHSRDSRDESSLENNFVDVPENVQLLFESIVWLHICQLRGLEEQHDLTMAEIESLYIQNRPSTPEASAADDANVPTADLDAPAPSPFQQGRRSKIHRLQRLSKMIDKLPLRLIRRLGKSKRDDPVRKPSLENVCSTEQSMFENAAVSNNNAASDSNTTASATISPDIAAVPQAGINEVHDNAPETGEAEPGPSVPNALGMHGRAKISRWSLMPFAQRNISRHSLGQATRNRLTRLSSVF